MSGMGQADNTVNTIKNTNLVANPNNSKSFIAQPQNTAEFTPPTTIPVVNHNCGLSQYNDPMQGCMPCISKCSTCINSVDQCLSCAENRTRRGWKFATSECVAYNLSLKVPTNQ